MAAVVTRVQAQSWLMDGLPEVSWREVMFGQRLEEVLDHRRRLCVHVLMQQAKIAGFYRLILSAVND